MRIVEVVLSLDIGGQERLVLRMAQAFQERGHDVHVVTLTGGGTLRGELGSIPVHDVVRGRGFDAGLYPRLWRLFRSLRPDVVHTHNAVPLEYAAPAARFARVPCTVHTKHGHIDYSKASLQLARAATRFVDHFVAVSADTALTAERNERPSKKRLVVIENGIPLGKFAPDEAVRAAVRDELGIPRDARVVGSVGRLVEEKDYPLLVRAMTPLLGEHMRLVIVGEGIVRAEVEAAIAPSVRPFVTLTGARRDVSRMLCAFDVYASSSRAEGLPLALAEAMASRLPIVATAVGGVPDIVPAQLGVLVPHGDPEALRAALQRLLDDPQARSAMGEAARRYALERFAEERMLDRYLALYDRRAK
ncbi:MAG TPA: glycosyltransferase [Labilithrix sp.]|nr:glycosyltransferase [Labilithrix sp.]